MINLIPPDAKRSVRREYYTRIAVVYLWLGIIAGIIVGTVLASPLIFIHYQTRVTAEEFDTAAGQQAEMTELVETIEVGNELLDELVVYADTEPLMPLVLELQSYAGSQIAIENISIARTETRSIAEVEVGGTAATRQALASFETQLEAASQFGDITLPLANLARERDLPFRLTVPLVEVN